MILAFSTCWNSARHQRGDEMLQEIVDLGFRAVELGHGVRLPLLDGIRRFASDSGLAITSLHNYCPLPIDIVEAAPDCFQCTSHRPGERARARRHTFETIDWATQLGAKRVILHLGSVPMSRWSRRLISQMRTENKSDRRYVNWKEKAVRKRGKLDYYQRVVEELVPVIEHARQAGVRLGIENRIGIETFPSEQEFKRLFNDFGTDVLGYWHDFGHAQIRHHLELLNHREWFIEMLPYLLGCHVHDVKSPDCDHQPPFTGDTPLSELTPLVPVSVPLVWELRPSVTPAEIRMARQRWNALFKNDDESLVLSG
jgi:sugar phosphate isomerase/epimerase